MHAHTPTYTHKVILQFIFAFKFYVVWVFCTLVHLSSLECLWSPEEGTEPLELELQRAIGARN